MKSFYDFLRLATEIVKEIPMTLKFGTTIWRLTNLLTFVSSATFCLPDLALELNPGSQYYEDSDAEVMVPFGSVAAE